MLYLKKSWFWIISVLLCAAQVHAQPFYNELTCTPQTTRYIERFGDERVNLYENKYDTSAWRGEYDQDSEPQSDYCGATAGKNALFWYGNDVSYSTLASEMKTNDYSIPKSFGVCQTACVAVGIPDPWPFFPCSFSCVKTIKKYASRGSLPKYVTKALEKHAPTGYSLHSFQSSGELEDILEPLSEGNPVVALISLAEKNLHWATVVGYYRNAEGQLMLRIAGLNSDFTWDEWKKLWSLKRVTDKKAVRYILKDVGAYKPYTMMYYSKGSSNWDVEYDVDPREAQADEVCQLTWNKNNPSEPPKYAFLSTAGGPHCGYRKLEKQDDISQRNNVALNKNATQSSTVFNIDASRAVDGNTDGDWKHGSVSQTTIENRAWWKVDLGSSHRVDGVTIWNRTDCCADNLADFHVDYLDSAGRVIAKSNHMGKAGTRTNIHLAATDVYAVRVQLNGNNSLVLAEVQVWGSKNVALAKYASQSSTDYDGSPSRAVDGNTDGYWSHGSVTHTKLEKNPWWEVDLGSSHRVDGVTIWNRTAYGERLTDFHVDYLNSKGNVIAKEEYAGRAGLKTDISLTAHNVHAVRIQLSGKNPLSLAEVQVWGAENVAIGKDATQSSTIYNGFASRAVDGNTDGNWFNGSVTHTNNDQGAWWSVDLGSDYDVTGVTIWNRTDSCSDRLVFFYLDYMDGAGNVIESHMQWGAITENNIPLAASGVQAVRVRFHRSEYLSLAEVQVWGSRSIEPIMPIDF